MERFNRFCHNHSLAVRTHQPPLVAGKALSLLLLSLLFLTGCVKQRKESPLAPPEPVQIKGDETLSQTTPLSVPSEGFGSPGPAPAAPGPWTHYKGEATYRLGKPYKVNGTWYFPAENKKYDEIGFASWYGQGFQNKPTANGELFDGNALSAAHKTLPLPSIVRVTHLENGKSVIVRVNDRGPFANDKLIDLSPAAARTLEMIPQGSAKVRVEFLPAESAAALQTIKGSQVPIPPASPPLVAEAPLPPPEKPSSSLGSGEVSGDAAQNSPPAGEELFDGDSLNANLPGTPAVSLPSASEDKPADEQGLFYIQAGSFGKKENAEKLKQKLEGFGNCTLKEVQQKGILFYRVILGPHKEASVAQEILEKVRMEGSPDARLLRQT